MGRARETIQIESVCTRAMERDKERETGERDEESKRDSQKRV